MKGKAPILRVLAGISFLALVAQAGAVGASEPKSLNVISTAFKQGATIPKKYGGEGEDFSPSLLWSALPKATKSIAISCLDPDAPSGTWWHWTIYNLPAKMQQLGENVPKSPSIAQGIAQGMNDFGKVGYNGPMPPPGQKHHYHFKVMALDTVLNLRPGASKEEFSKAIHGHELASGELVGIYSR